ncbi:MAG: PrsW family glutamic-type intramembrane protease [Lentimonas sp.]
MKHRNLFNRTRSSGFLWKGSFAIICSFLVIGTIISWLNPTHTISLDGVYNTPDFYDTFEEVSSLINIKKLQAVIVEELNSQRPFDEKLESFQYLITLDFGGTASLLPQAAQVPKLTASEYSVVDAFAKALSAPSKQNDEASETHLQPLTDLTLRTPVEPYAHYALALYYYDNAQYLEAITAIQSEISTTNLDRARELLISLCLERNDYDAIERLQNDLEFAPFINSRHLQEIALARLDWPQLIKTLIPAAYVNVQPSMAFLAILTAIIWSAFLIRLNDTAAHHSTLLKLALPALILGVLSTHLTILLIFLQEHQFGLTEGDTLITQTIYCFAGIGLREEFLKLLCFVPLLPFLVKKNNELLTLIVASLVGLGFAAEENINYFEMSQGASGIGRFVTANFLHLSLTGLCGLALTRAVQHSGYYINQAINTFGLAVIAHGAYDAFIIVPELFEYSILTTIVFVLIVYQFFATVRGLRRTWTSPFSVTAQFSFSLAVVTGATFATVAWSYGAFPAFLMVATEVITLGILLVVFFREIPESIQ